MEWDSQAIKNYKSVDKIKKQLRKGNWSYLCRHPEIRAIIRVFIHEAINQQPDNIFAFGAKLFDCNDSAMLIEKINKQLKCVNEQLKKSQWTKHDGDSFFIENQSTHSLLSKSSISDHADEILKFSMIYNKSATKLMYESGNDR